MVEIRWAFGSETNPRNYLYIGCQLRDQEWIQGEKMHERSVEQLNHPQYEHEPEAPPKKCPGPPGCRGPQRYTDVKI